MRKNDGTVTAFILQIYINLNQLAVNYVNFARNIPAKI